MSARRRLARRCAALFTTLVLAAALPGIASAAPAGNGPGPRSAVSSQASAPEPTVVRTVVREDAVRALPIALAGAAMLIAIAGAGYAVARTAPQRHQLRGQQ